MCNNRTQNSVTDKGVYRVAVLVLIKEDNLKALFISHSTDRAAC